MFLVEITASFVTGSVSLRAGALDFLADALNYVIALAVIGLSLRWRARAALIKGGIMAVFGLWVAGSIVGNAISRSVPEAHVMSTIGLLALLAMSRPPCCSTGTARTTVRPCRFGSAPAMTASPISG